MLHHILRINAGFAFAADCQLLLMAVNRHREGTYPTTFYCLIEHRAANFKGVSDYNRQKEKLVF